MIDTVRLSRAYNCALPPKVKANFKPLADRFVLNLRLKDGASTIQLTWRTTPPGISYLTASASLPKLLHGTNVKMLSDGEISIVKKGLSDLATEASGVEFDVDASMVTRLDSLYDWKVGEERVCDYLYAARDATFPRLKRDAFQTGTVQFKSRSGNVCLSIYSKHQETAKLVREGKATEADLEASVGLLRIERRLATRAACQRLAERMKLPSRRADQLLRLEIAGAIMEETLKHLGLNNPIVSGDLRLQRLRERYGHSSTYKRLAGFIALCDEHGAESLVPLGLYSKTSYYEYRKQAMDAGALFATKSKSTLPPLLLERGHSSAREGLG